MHFNWTNTRFAVNHMWASLLAFSMYFFFRKLCATFSNSYIEHAKWGSAWGWCSRCFFLFWGQCSQSAFWPSVSIDRRLFIYFKFNNNECFLFFVLFVRFFGSFLWRNCKKCGFFASENEWCLSFDHASRFRLYNIMILIICFFLVYGRQKQLFSCRFLKNSHEIYD